MNMTKADYDELVRRKSDGFKYIARDLYRKVYAYIKKPIKFEQVWASSGRFPSEGCELMKKGMFEFVKWSDENPINIAAAIAEYEREHKEDA